MEGIIGMRSLKFALSPQDSTEFVERINDFAIACLSEFDSAEIKGKKLYMFETALFPISSVI